MKSATIAFVIAVAGCAANTPMPQPETSVAEARALYEESYRLGHPWRAARQAVEAAETALENGALEDAAEAAAEAKALSEAAIAQARSEADSATRKHPFAE